MTRILVDATLVLDVLLDRQPHADAAAAVWSAVERGRTEGLLSAQAVTALHDHSVGSVGAAKARETTQAVLSVFGVAGVDELAIRAALSLDLPNFEDAVTVAAAQRAKCVAIVSRHPRRFRKSPIRVLTPEEAAAWLSASHVPAADERPLSR